MDIDKLIPKQIISRKNCSFGSLMDIDKLIPCSCSIRNARGFGSLMDIDKLIPLALEKYHKKVLVL